MRYTISTAAGLTVVALLTISAHAVAAGVPLPQGPLTADPAFDKGITYTRTLHVRTTGNDSSGNGSEAAPYRTLTKALGLATPGTKIVMHEGTYLGYTSASNRQGTPTQPILVTTAPGEGPVILDGNGGGEVMHLIDVAWLVIENITFQNSTSNGINIDDGGTYATPTHHVILRNLTVQNIGTGGNNDGIKLSGVDNIYVVGCLIKFIRSGSGIDMVGCHDSVIGYNEFNDMGSNSTQTKGGSRNILIIGNLFIRGGDRAMNMGGSTGAAYFRPIDAPYEAKDISAIGNLLKDCGAPFAFVSSVDGIVANNTVYMPTGYLIRILNENTSKLPTQGGTFFNNIIYFRKSSVNSTAVNIGPNTLPNTFTFASNLWYAIDDPNFSGYSLPTPETNGIYRQNPLFFQLGDAAGTQVNDDFRLHRASPARARGLSVPAFDWDADGTAETTGDRDGRAYLAAPTLGAYEIGLDGDATGDGHVNVFDLQKMAAAWNAQAGQPNYNRYCDYNEDNKVNVFDLQMMAVNWNK